MKLGLHQSARLEQRLVQSPQMIQAMQVLQLPSLDLAERIEQELTENPFLEVVEDRDESGPDGASDDGAPDGTDGMLDLLERIEGEYGDGTLGVGARSRIAAVDAGERKYEAMMQAPDAPASLAEALLVQLADSSLTPREEAIVEYVVWSLDGRGYLTETPATLAAELTRAWERESGGAAVAVETEAPEAAATDDEDDADTHVGPVTEDEVRDALERLREAAHPGLGALDLRECLLLQLPGAGLWSPFMRQLVEDHLDDVQANRLPQIARATKRDIEDVKAAVEILGRLDPVPGAGFGESPAEVIHPEVVVDLDDGELDIRIDRERTPRLRVNPLYKRMLAQGTRAEKDWVRKRLESASWFIDALEQRESTLRRIATAIFSHQRAFLERGKEALRPLRMQEIADEVDVHISTVSRAVAGKYAQTPRGIFPLKFFFTGGTAKASGELTSQVTIKEKIKRIVSEEDPAHPLSDDGIAHALEESEGIRIARRTVTKYRKALGIPASTRRREY